MPDYILTETRLTYIDQRSIRIETYRDSDSGRFRLLTYELLPADGAPHPHAHRHWTTLSYNLEETEDSAAAIQEILHKITVGALPDHLAH